MIASQCQHRHNDTAQTTAELKRSIRPNQPFSRVERAALPTSSEADPPAGRPQIEIGFVALGRAEQLGKGCSSHDLSTFY